MAELITSDDLIAEGNLGSETDAEILMPHIEMAIIEAKKILTSGQYVILVAYEKSDDDDKTDQFNQFKKGLINLALSYAIHALNIETQGNGIVRSKGWDQSRSELLSRNEVKDLSAHFREIAMNLFQPLIPIEAVSDDDEDGEANDTDLGNIYMSAL